MLFSTIQRLHRKTDYSIMKYRMLSTDSAIPSISESTACISIFFSDCDIMKQSGDLLASLGFKVIQPAETIKSSRLFGSFQSSRISSGLITLELISDPLFTKIRKSYGKRSSFARVIEIRRSTPNKRFQPIASLCGNTFFSGFYPLTALTQTLPHTALSFASDGTDDQADTDTFFIGSQKSTCGSQKSHFDCMKEIIIPCSAYDFEDTQSNVELILGAKSMSKNLPGLYDMMLSSNERIVVRTAPTNTFTMILKVADLGVASQMLQSLNALGDAMGRNSASSNGQIQIRMPGLDGGVEFRITDSDTVSAFYAEPPQSIIADTVMEMQSPRVLIKGGGADAEKDVPRTVGTGDCWKEVRVRLSNITK
jgi:hypothetical protein